MLWTPFPPILFKINPLCLLIQIHEPYTRLDLRKGFTLKRRRTLLSRKQDLIYGKLHLFSCRSCPIRNKSHKKGIVLLLHTQLKSFLFKSVSSGRVHSAIITTTTTNLGNNYKMSINISCLWFPSLNETNDNKLHLLTHAIKLYESCQFEVQSESV